MSGKSGGNHAAGRSHRTEGHAGCDFGKTLIDETIGLTPVPDPQITAYVTKILASHVNIRVQ